MASGLESEAPRFASALEPVERYDSQESERAINDGLLV